MNDYLPSLEDFLSGKVKTLGWGVLNWCSTYLAHPDGDLEGQQWAFYDEQALFILRLYALRDDGSFLYDRAILERPKKWGKSPLLAALCCAELLGPVRFAYWNAKGEPVGKVVSKPLIQIAAISEDQANNTYDCVMPMLLNGKASYAYNLTAQHVMLSKVITDANGKIQKVTASPRGRQGQRVTFVVCDETHLWVPAEKGPELFEAIDNNATGMNTRVVETTNAPVPGEGSVAESSHKAVEKLIEKGGDIRILLDTRNVDVEDITDYQEVMPALRYVYGDAAIEVGGHVDLDRIYRKFIDPASDEHSNRRFYLNQRMSGKAAWLSKNRWMPCECTSNKLRRNDLISLGFKGTKFSTALVACRLTDGALFVLGHWEKTIEPEWKVPFDQIDTKVRKTLEERDVCLGFFEPERWQDIVARWHADYEVVEEFWWSNKQKIVRATEQFESAVDELRLSHNDERLTRHVYNAQIEEYPQGRTIRKESKGSSKHIALAQAAILAYTAATVAIDEGALSDRDNHLYTW
jgi:hypothetical protein